MLLEVQCWEGEGGVTRRMAEILVISWAVKIVLFVLLTGSRSKVPSRLLDTHEDGWREKKEKRDNGWKAIEQA